MHRDEQHVAARLKTERRPEGTRQRHGDDDELDCLYVDDVRVAEGPPRPRGAGAQPACPHTVAGEHAASTGCGQTAGVSLIPDVRSAPVAPAALSAVETMAEMQQCLDLWNRVWTRADGDIVPLSMLKALVHSGNYLWAYREAGVVAGAALGFLGEVDGQIVLHSHVMAVDRAWRGRGVGSALKHHQRDWCVSRGVSRIRWTYDPLLVPNARLNLDRLGARGIEYVEDFYGALHDAFNAQDRTDRIVVEWDLAAATPEASSSRPQGVVVALDALGVPRACPTAADDPRRVLSCPLPQDILALRGQHPELAAAWRTAVRIGLGSALRAGYRATATHRGPGYLLTREDR